MESFQEWYSAESDAEAKRPRLTVGVCLVANASVSVLVNMGSWLLLFPLSAVGVLGFNFHYVKSVAVNFEGFRMLYNYRR